MNNMAVDNELFKELMRRFAAGVTLVTFNENNKFGGLTVSSFCSLSMNPPLVLICIDRKIVSQDSLENADTFGVNICNSEQGKLACDFANSKIDKNGKFLEELVSCRKSLNFILSKPDSVEYVDVSPKQLVSVAASLIPFLENDDANRALMGSNMMRQAVPLIKPESPLVGTGIERDVALDSGVTIIARADGVVDKIDGKRIVVKSFEKDLSKSGVEIYNLLKFKK